MDSDMVIDPALEGLSSASTPVHPPSSAATAPTDSSNSTSTVVAAAAPPSSIGLPSSGPADSAAPTGPAAVSALPDESASESKATLSDERYIAHSPDVESKERILQADERLQQDTVERVENAYLDPNAPSHPTTLDTQANDNIQQLSEVLSEQENQPEPTSGGGGGGGEGDSHEIKLEKMHETVLPSSSSLSDIQSHEVGADSASQQGLLVPFGPTDTVERDEEGLVGAPSIAGSNSTLSTLDDTLSTVPHTQLPTREASESSFSAPPPPPSASSSGKPASAGGAARNPSSRPLRRTTSRTLEKDAGATISGEPSASSSGRRASSARNASEKPASSSSAAGTGGTSRTRASAAHNNVAASSSTSAAHPPAAGPSPSTSTATRSSRRTTAAAKDEKTSKEPSASTSSRASSRVKKEPSYATLGETSETLLPTNGSNSISSRSRGTARSRAAAGELGDHPEDEKAGPGRRRPARAGSDDEAGREENDGGESEEDGIVRCVCNKQDPNSNELMIQCEICAVWQHAPCVGFQNERDCPDVYYCELCRPDLHPTLTRKKHGRTASSSSRAGLASRAEERESSSTSTPKPISRDQHQRRETSSSQPPTAPGPAAGSASSSSTSASHRRRPSAEAAVATSLPDYKKASPSPGAVSNSAPPSAKIGASEVPPGSQSPGGTYTGPMSADGKRPMYPPTSHLSAPLQPKRRSTMNSRDSAAFDESIMLANVNAFKESRMMALALSGNPEKGGSSSGGSRKRRRNQDSSEREDSEDPMNTSANTTRDGHDGMGVLNEEDEEEMAEQEDAITRGRREDDASPVAAEEETVQVVRMDALRADPAEEAGSIVEVGEEVDDLEDGETGAPQSASKKRRRRRGAGAVSTARSRKTPAKGRAAPPVQKVEEEELGMLEGSMPVPGLGIEEGDASGNARKRKRQDVGEKEHANDVRPESPNAVNETPDTSTSSDKPLGNANKRRKGSPSIPSMHIDIGDATPVLGEEAPAQTDGVQVNNVMLADNAPSPSASVSTVAASIQSSGKDREGMLQPPAHTIGRGKRVIGGLKAANHVEETEEEAEDSSNATLALPAALAALKNKHPNQYTYKRSTAGSRGNKHSPHKRGGDGRRGNRDETPNFDDFLNQPPTWGIPDHLSHLSHLLPGPGPSPLQVTSYVRSPAASAAPSPVEPTASSSLAQDAPPSTSASSSSSAASTRNVPEAIALTHPEPPTKIRFPARRMSTTEMRKRTKNVLDFLARCQVEMADRHSRNAALGLSSLGPSPLSSPHPSQPGQGSATPQSVLMMDDLSRQLMSFQEKYL